MNDLQIDEEYLIYVKDGLENTIEVLQEYIKAMINIENDMFTRYRAFVITKNINAMINVNYELIKENFVLGKWGSHSIFKSEVKEIKCNPFFKQDEINCKPFQDAGEEMKKRFEEFLCNLVSNSDLEENNKNSTEDSKPEITH